MQVQFFSRALLASSAALFLWGVPADSVGSSHARAEIREIGAAASRGSLSDSMHFGLSGKLRGPLVSYLSRQPFSAKVDGRIGQYLMGFWPAERGRVNKGAYQNPEGFVEVTPENQNTPVSEHFRLRDFVTHDQ